MYTSRDWWIRVENAQLGNLLYKRKLEYLILKAMLRAGNRPVLIS